MHLISRLVDRLDTGTDDQPTSLTTLVHTWWTARRFWAQADTFAALADLTALYLEGAVDRSPTHCGPPADETASIRDRLAVLNRTGLVVTYGSQPGEVDEYGRQRAFVEFFADGETTRRVEAACRLAGLRVFARRPVVDALLSCWQVTVADPEWERNDLLWDTLADALAVAR